MLVVIGVLNRFNIVREMLGNLLDSTLEADVLFIDNGSNPPLANEGWIPDDVLVVRYEEPVGNYPLFKIGLELGRDDILAFLHSDVYVYESGWDIRVMQAFDNHPRLGLLGFVGSNQIERDGGRGLGTTSNFQGRQGGGEAEVHGARNVALTPAAVVDGCAMVFRRQRLEEIGFLEDFPPHHFYDRVMSCQILEKGNRVGVLGVACDHISGQTVAHEQKYHDLAMQWALAHGLDVSQGGDYAIYREAERRFLTEWRDQKRFIPLTVLGDWTIGR